MTEQREKVNELDNRKESISRDELGKIQTENVEPQRHSKLRD